MKNRWLLTILLCVLGSSVWALDVLVPAGVSCRTDINNPDSNRHDSSKLSIRSDGSAAKSWIRFDISGLAEPNSIRAAVLRLSLHEDKSGEQNFDVSAVNDDYTANIDWAEREITWNNAPANDTDDFMNPDFTQASLMGTVTFNNALAGDQFFVDVSDAIQADTDGIVQFILHNASGLLNCATHDHPNGEAYWPTLVFTYPPLGADYPSPEVGETVTTGLAELSWVNPEPNSLNDSIYCDVYLGTDPNRTDTNVDKITLGSDVQSVTMNTANFPKNGSLQDDQVYYWVVDCYDTGTGQMIPGEWWSFTVNNNQPPTVAAGDDQVIWLTQASTVQLVGTADDDGLPADPGALTTTWTQTAGPDSAVIETDSQLSTTVTFTENGDYTFTLTADDGELPVSDTVRIVVGDDACDASHIESGEPYNEADVNEDCIVDLLDFAELIASDWLNCTDTLTNCN